MYTYMYIQYKYVQLVLEFKKVDFAKYLILVVGLLLSKPKGEEGPKLLDFAIGYTWIYQVFSGPNAGMFKHCEPPSLQIHYLCNVEESGRMG